MLCQGAIKCPVYKTNRKISRLLIPFAKFHVISIPATLVDHAQEQEQEQVTDHIDLAYQASLMSLLLVLGLTL